MIIKNPQKVNIDNIARVMKKMIKKDTKKLEVDIDMFRLPKDVEPKASINFSSKALQKIKALIDISSKEVGWRGVVERTAQNAFTITDIHVYPQEVTGATVAARDETELFKWLFTFPDEVFNNLRMQGHSHVRMGCTPSGVDQAYYEALMTQVEDYYIFMIANKNDATYFEIHDVVNGVVYEDSDITTNFKAKPYASWARKQLEEQVIEKPKVFVAGTNNAVTNANTRQPNQTPRRVGTSVGTLYQGTRTY